MNKLAKQAFTLIELLVVIAIIGILSGLIVVSIGGMTTKANIAKAQVFSNSLRNSLMMNLVAEYKLDGNGNDFWGGHDAITTTATVSSDCVYNSCLYFNGSTYVAVADDATFDFGSKMTIMIWVKGVAQSAKLVQGQWDFGINQRAWEITNSSISPYDKLMITISDNGTLSAGHWKQYYTSTSIAFDNNWHLVGFTWNNGTLKLYVDGVEAATTKLTDDPITAIFNSSAGLTFGCQLTSGTPTAYFTGSMDEARMYNEVISLSQIKEQYYSGLNKMLVSGKITNKEYENRKREMAIK